MDEHRIIFSPTEAEMYYGDHQILFVNGEAPGCYAMRLKVPPFELALLRRILRAESVISVGCYRGHIDLTLINSTNMRDVLTEIGQCYKDTVAEFLEIDVDQL